MIGLDQHSNFRSYLLETLCSLSNDRPVFHSEADFQLEFALRLRMRFARVRLEVPPVVIPGETACRGRLDVWLPEQRIGIELKYERSWNRGKSPKKTEDGFVTHNNETYRFPWAMSDKIVPGFINDVGRLSGWVGKGIDRGYAVMLTNDPGLWECDNLSTQLREQAGTDTSELFGIDSTSLWHDYSKLDAVVPCPEFRVAIVEAVAAD